MTEMMLGRTVNPCGHHDLPLVDANAVVDELVEDLVRDQLWQVG